MPKSALLLLSAVVCLSGCALLRPTQPSPSPLVTCPAPPMLPPIDKLPPEVLEPAFLHRLEQRMFVKPSGPM